MGDHSHSNGANGKASATPVTALDDDAQTTDPVPAPRAAAAERYVLDREIGHGGMGRVFSGRDLRLGRTVAIKMLRTQDAALAVRFEREVKLAARLQHPGVVPVYDAGFWPSGEPFLVMKLVLGQSLARVIRDADTRADRIALLPQVIAAAEAVAYAHDQGVVHRDLKPSNILVGAFGETVVVDWGLAKDLRVGQEAEERATGDGRQATGDAGLGSPDRAAPESGLPSPPPSPASGRGSSDCSPAEVKGGGAPLSPSARESSGGAGGGAPLSPSPREAGRGLGRGAGDTATGAVIGTPSYMSPEQAAGQPVDPRADVYALGAILHYVLAGTAPQAMTPLASLEPRLPPDLLAIVDKALAADAARRYPSAFELADDLKRFASGQLVDARRYSPLARAGRFVARHPIAVAIAVSVAIAAVIAFGFR
jgi:serine/threonine protein kinase